MDPAPRAGVALAANEAEGRNAPACAPIVNRNSRPGHAEDLNHFIANATIDW
jgi:hypothetical protein